MVGHGRSIARIAVSGAGWWGQGWHLPHLHRNPASKIAAIVEKATHPRSSNASQALKTVAELSEEYSAPVYSSVEELLASTTDIDGLLVGTPHAVHFEQSMLAIDAGVHVLCEKPMTTSVAQAQELERAARAHAEAGRFFAVNNTANWRAPARVAAQAVGVDHRIGEVQHVSAHMHSPLLWLFDDANNVGWTAPVGDMAGNGFAWGQLSHLLAWIFHVAPSLAPQSAFCSMVHSDISGADLHDAATIVCTNGASISVSGTASVPGDAHGDAPIGKRIGISMFGSQGSIVFEGDDQDAQSGVLGLRRRDGQPYQVLHPEFAFENYEPGGDGPESVQSLIDACVGRPAYVGANATVGLKTVQAIEAMYRSAASGRVEECI